MDNREDGKRHGFVSPYLRARLRSLEEAERARERAHARRRPSLPGSELGEERLKSDSATNVLSLFPQQR